MRCMNFSEERESSERTTFSLPKMHLDAELVDRHPILDVAVEAVGLLDQEGAAGGGVAAQERDHVAERTAAGALGCFDVLEFLDDANAPAARVFIQQLALRG